MTERHLEDELAAYALGTLEPDQAAAVESHLSHCAHCSERAREWEELAGTLPLALPEEPLPPALKARILATVQAQPSSAAPGLTPPTREPVSPGSRVIPFRAAPRTFGLALAAMLLLASGVLLGRATAGQNVTPAARYQQMLGQAVANGSRLVSLKQGGVSTPMALAITAAGHASLVVGPAASPPPHKVYQLWLLRKGSRPRSAAVFSPAPTHAQTVRLARLAGSYASAAVTIEPGPRGSAQPTTPVILSGNLAVAVSHT